MLMSLYFTISEVLKGQQRTEAEVKEMSDNTSASLHGIKHHLEDHERKFDENSQSVKGKCVERKS